MKDFSYIGLLAKKAETVGSVKAKLKIAEQMENLLRSTITELKIQIKREHK
jgi:hypothetical protein